MGSKSRFDAQNTKFSQLLACLKLITDYSVKVNTEKTVKMPKRKRTFDKEPYSDSDFDPSTSHTRPYKRRNKLAKRDDQVYYPEVVVKNWCVASDEEDPTIVGKKESDSDPEDEPIPKIYKRRVHLEEVAVEKVMEAKQLAER